MNVVQIRAGHDHIYALNSEGGVACWGLDAQGQRCDGSTAQQFSPVPVQGS